MTQTQPRQTSRLKLDAFFFVGAAIRIGAVSAFLVMGFAILDFFRTAAFLAPMFGSTDSAERGLSGELILAVLAGLAPLLWPFSIVAMIAECQILLLRGVGFSSSSVQVLLPAAFAVIGGVLGNIYFCRPGDVPLPAAGVRLFVLGSAILFYLAASFQIWNWDRWHGMTPTPTPVLWYGILICLVGAFLGSRIAWDAPSPYLREMIEHRERIWDPAEHPRKENLLPYEEPPAY